MISKKTFGLGVKIIGKLFQKAPAPQQSGDNAAINFQPTSHPGIEFMLRSGRPYAGALPRPGVRLKVETRTRSRRPYTVVVPDAKIKKEQLDRASSPVPPGVMVEEGQRVVAPWQRTMRHAPTPLPALTRRGANAQVALRNQADQSALVIGGNLVTA
jgi:hypothetical protein